MSIGDEGTYDGMGRNEVGNQISVHDSVQGWDLGISDSKANVSPKKSLVSNLGLVDFHLLEIGFQPQSLDYDCSRAPSRPSLPPQLTSASDSAL